MPVRAVVFDLDDTLYEEKAAKVAAECAVAAGIADRTGLPLPAALSAFLASKRMVLSEHALGPARIERGRWIAHALAEASIADDHLAVELEETYWATLLSRIEAYADAVIAVPHLAATYDLWVATNELRSYQRLKLERLGLATHFRGFVSADEVGHEKPAPEFFCHLAEVVGEPPESVVFVGDNPLTDVLGACRAGLRSVFFRRGAFASFDVGSVPGCAPTWQIDYLTEIAGLLEAA